MENEEYVLPPGSEIFVPSVIGEPICRACGIEQSKVMRTGRHYPACWLVPSR